jgi:hypothetical protein
MKLLKSPFFSLKDNDPEDYRLIKNKHGEEILAYQMALLIMYLILYASFSICLIIFSRQHLFVTVLSFIFYLYTGSGGPSWWLL